MEILDHKKGGKKPQTFLLAVCWALLLLFDSTLALPYKIRIGAIFTGNKRSSNGLTFSSYAE